jgi:hypothetical protein
MVQRIICWPALLTLKTNTYMNYDFNQPLKALNGEVLKDQDNKPLTAGKLLANALVSGAKGDAMKLHGWAVKMYNAQKLNLDKSDVRVLTDFVDANETITILAKSQILGILTDPKNAAE